MGRIQKKKDPEKKKALKTEKSNQEATSISAGGNGTLSKSTPAIKKTAVQAKSKAANAEPNLVQKALQFLLEVKIELKKVAWPSRKQTMGSTVVVIVLVFIISVFLGVVDFGLTSIVNMVLP